MVGAPHQYSEKVLFGSVVEDVNEWNQPIETLLLDKESWCRYENYLKGGFKEYPKEDGTSVLADGTISLPKNQEIPKRYDIIELPKRGIKAQVLHVFESFQHFKLFIKEIK